MPSPCGLALPHPAPRPPLPDPKSSIVVFDLIGTPHPVLLCGPRRKVRRSVSALALAPGFCWLSLLRVRERPSALARYPRSLLDASTLSLHPEWLHPHHVSVCGGKVKHIARARIGLAPAAVLRRYSCSLFAGFLPSPPRLSPAALTPVHCSPSPNTSAVGTQIPFTHFAGTPQGQALLNLMITSYISHERRIAAEVRFQVPPAQLPLLERVGLEYPRTSTLIAAPHGFHKVMEETNLALARRFLVPNEYGLISCKPEKEINLPPPGSRQYPTIEAKDVSRFPGAWCASADYTRHPVYLAHDIASQVTPHELVEHISRTAPDVHLFVTGVLPPEVLKRNSSYWPNSHSIEYEGDMYTWLPYQSESQGYTQSVTTTTAWLRSNGVMASDGTVYHVVLLDERYGHCLFHVFRGAAAPQLSRQFSTGSYVRVPALLSGTYQDEYVNQKFLTGMLDFSFRTPLDTVKNLASKAKQLANGSQAHISAREQRIGVNVARQADGYRNWSARAWHMAYRAACFFMGNWSVAFNSMPLAFDGLLEDKRTHIVCPTVGGGWTPQPSLASPLAAIPNFPSWLERMSAASASFWSFLLPKVLLGQLAYSLVWSWDVLAWARHIWTATGMSVGKLVLPIGAAALTAALPAYLVRAVTRAAGHHYRLLWLPWSVSGAYTRVVQEVCGGPGYRWFVGSPGRGWAWQLGLAAFTATEFLPGLLPHCSPWLALTAANSPLAAAFAVFWVGVVVLTYADHWAVSRRLTAVDPPVPLRGRTWSYVLRLARSRYIRWYCAKAVREAPSAGPNPLPAVPLPPALAISRTRKVDTVIPSLPVRPAPPIGPALTDAPPNTGLTFPEFLREVEAWYQRNPMAYPPLEAGASCVFDCFSSVGGTPHMWFSWYRSTYRVAANALVGPVGTIQTTEIGRLAGASGVGVCISGSLNQAYQPLPGYPVVHLDIAPAGTGYHVTLQAAAAVGPTVSALARVLATVRRVSVDWFEELAYRQQRRPDGPLPRLAPLALACHQFADATISRADLDLAFRTSTYSAAIAVNDRQFRWNLALFPNGDDPDGPAFTWPDVVETTPAADAPVGGKNTRPKRGPRHAFGPDGFVPLGSDGKALRARNVAGVARPPQVPRWSTLRSELEAELTPWIDQSLPVAHLEPETIQFKPSLERARRLASDLRGNASLLESHDGVAIAQAIDAIIDLHIKLKSDITVEATLLFGVPGCGKTTQTAAILRSMTSDERRNARVVTHQNTLRAEARENLDFPEFRGFNLPSLLSILREPSSGTIFFDDAGKAWPGIVDVVVIANPLVTRIVVNGDPGQGVAHIPMAGAMSEHEPNSLAPFAAVATKYATVTHRLFSLMADTLGVHTSSLVRGHISHCTETLTHLRTLTSSPRYVQVLMHGAIDSYTFDSAQGHDWKEEVVVDMTGLEGAITDHTATVALTRSKTGVWLKLNALSPTSSVLAAPTSSNIVNALVYALREQGGSLVRPDPLVKAAYLAHLARVMPRLVHFARVGYTTDLTEFCPFIPAAITTQPEETAVVETLTQEDVAQEWAPTDSFVAELYDLPAKEFRENRRRGVGTDQFQDLRWINPPRHKRDDNATYWMGVQKRLTPATARQNLRRMEEQPRDELIEVFHRLVPHPPKMTPDKLAEYTDLAVHEYTAKRARDTVLRKIAAHDPDRTGRDIRASMKAQTINKEEKAGGPAVAPQMIHEYDISVTIHDAPYFLFLEKELLPAFPPHINFFARESMTTFVDRVGPQIHQGRGTTSSDVTAWDVGCDAGLLNFDLAVFRACSLPEDWVQGYLDRRLHSRSQHGPMATMQNSGDRGTWTMNSIRRACVSTYVLAAGDAGSAAHNLPTDRPGGTDSDVTMLVNGDDDWVDFAADIRPLADSPWVFKQQQGPVTPFSGFELAETGSATYSPAGLLYRCQVLDESPARTDKTRWLGYADLLPLVTTSDSAVFEIVRLMSPRLDAAHLYTRIPDHLKCWYVGVY